MVRHFLRDDDLSPGRAARGPRARAAAEGGPVRGAARWPGRARSRVIFDKPTLRTQLSFTVGVAELGGYPMVVDGNLARIGVRESVTDTARVLGASGRGDRLAHLRPVAARGDGGSTPGVPVVNALTDQFHPCQVLADLLTVAQHRGGVEALAGPDARLRRRRRQQHGALLPARRRHRRHARADRARRSAACPTRRVVADARRIAAATGGSVTVTHDARGAVAGADVVATDTWVSMGQEAERPTGPRHRSAVPARRRGARARRAGRPRAALPAGLPRQGDHRRGDRGAAVGRLRRGGEPPARAEGAADLAAGAAVSGAEGRPTTVPHDQGRAARRASRGCSRARPSGRRPSSPRCSPTRGCTSRRRPSRATSSSCARSGSGRRRHASPTPCRARAATAPRMAAASAEQLAARLARLCAELLVTPSPPATSSCCAPRPGPRSSSPRRSTTRCCPACWARSPATTRSS